MKPRLAVDVGTDALESVRSDVLVVAVGPDDRPLRGAAGIADWRLCGQLWKLVSGGSFSGTRGAASLLVPGAGLASPLLLVIGLGPRASLNLALWRELGRAAMDRSLGLRAETVAFGLLADALGPDAESAALEAASASLIAGAALAVSARAASARLLLLGAPVTGLPADSIPAGVEVRQPPVATRPARPRSVARPEPARVGVQGISPARRFP